MTSKFFKPTENYRYKINVDEQGEQIEKLKNEGFKRIAGAIHNRVLWKNEDTGECVVAKYEYVLTEIAEVKEIEEKERD